MFKAGQVVRTRSQGFIYIVIKDEELGRYVHVKTLGLMHGTIPSDRLILVGNNFRRKTSAN